MFEEEFVITSIHSRFLKRFYGDDQNKTRSNLFYSAKKELLNQLKWKKHGDKDNETNINIMNF